jgi:hypothetical protein
MLKIKKLESYKKYKKSMDELLSVIERTLGEQKNHQDDYELCVEIINTYTVVTDDLLDEVDGWLSDPELSTKNKNAKSYREYTPIEKILFVGVVQIIADVDSIFAESLKQKDYKTLMTDPNFNIIVYSLDNIIFLLFLEIMDYLLNNNLFESYNYLSPKENNLDFIRFNNLYVFNNLN